MNRKSTEPLHPAQLKAIEKLKRLRVGALYIDRQEGKMRTVSVLVRYRLEKSRIDSVMWLCTRRKIQLIQSGIERYLTEDEEKIRVVGIESLSHSVKMFLDTMEWVKNRKSMLVIDNGLLVKNVRALRTRRVMEIADKCPYRLLISDMPFTKNIADIFSQWYLLDKRILGYNTFLGFSLNHIEKYGKPRNTAYIHRAIEPFCAQIIRRDVQPTGTKNEYVYRFELSDAGRAEYKRVMNRFLSQAMFSNTGVYRMLQACQQVISGQRVVRDYPLKTENLYDSDEDDPRLKALLSVADRYLYRPLLIIFKYDHEKKKILKALSERFGDENVAEYDGKGAHRARLTLMNINTDVSENTRPDAEAIIYYSNDWNWQKREEKERQCLNLSKSGALDVISLAAADTMDINILRSLWKKENLLESMRKGLTRTLETREK